MAALLGLELLHGGLEVVVGELGQLGGALRELLLDDLAVLLGDGVPDVDVDVSAAGADEVVGEAHLLGNLSGAVGGVSVHVALETVDNALLHGRDGLGEGHGGRGGAHGGQAVDVHGAVGNADLHALHVVGSLDLLVGLHAAETDVEVEREDVDAVVVLDVLAHLLHHVRLADVGILLEVGVEHRSDEGFEVNVVVGEVRGILAGDPVGAVDDLLEVVLVNGELAGAVGLDLNGAVGAVLDALSDLLHLDGELLGGSKHVAELEDDVEIVGGGGGLGGAFGRSGGVLLAAAGAEREHHDQSEKHCDGLLHGSFSFPNFKCLIAA